jgi:hypothetical protein
MKHPQQSGNALLRDSRRGSWVMTMPSAYFILEIGRDVRPVSGRACTLLSAQDPARVWPAERWLDVASWIAIGASFGLLYVALWWMVEKLLAAV